MILEIVVALLIVWFLIATVDLWFPIIAWLVVAVFCVTAVATAAGLLWALTQ